MSQKISFIYREFYDVPRMIVLRREGSLILLESVFDNETDDYSDSYEVFVLQDLSENEFQGSREDLRSKATKSLCQVLIRDVKFDPTLRKEIEATVIDDLLHQTSP